MNEKITIYCDGGCGRSVTLRKNKIQKCDYYICDSKESRDICKSKLPKRKNGIIEIHTFNAVAHFQGISYKYPDEKEKVNITRAKEILEIGLLKIPINNRNYENN